MKGFPDTNVDPNFVTYGSKKKDKKMEVKESQETINDYISSRGWNPKTISRAQMQSFLQSNHYRQWLLQRTKNNQVEGVENPEGEYEALDEVSAGYVKSAAKNALEKEKSEIASGNMVDAAKHGKRITSVLSRLKNRKVSEESEKLDEISKKTLGSYIKKAADDVSYRSFTVGGMDEKDPNREKEDKKSFDRQHKIGKAVDRLTKEDSEIDEHIVKIAGGYELKSRSTGKNLGKYRSKAGAEKRERQVQFFKHQHEETELDESVNKQVADLLAAGNKVHSRAAGRIGEILSGDHTGNTIKIKGGRGWNTFDHGDKVKIIQKGDKEYHVVNEESEIEEGWGADYENQKHEESKKAWEATKARHASHPEMTKHLNDLYKCNWNAPSAEAEAKKRCGIKEEVELDETSLLDIKKVAGQTLALHQVVGGGRAIFHKKTNKIVYTNPDNSKVMEKWKNLKTESFDELDEEGKKAEQDKEAAWKEAQKLVTQGKPVQKHGQKGHHRKDDHVWRTKNFGLYAGVDYSGIEPIQESKMSEIHQDMQDHLDKHIDHYKTHGGAEALWNHIHNTAGKISKEHGVEHKHALKWASDYADDRLSESNGSWKKDSGWHKAKPEVTVDKSGAKHDIYSRVRDLARTAAKKTKKDQEEQ